MRWVGDEKFTSGEDIEKKLPCLHEKRCGFFVLRMARSGDSKVAVFSCLEPLLELCQSANEHVPWSFLVQRRYFLHGHPFQLPEKVRVWR